MRNSLGDVSHSFTNRTFAHSLPDVSRLVVCEGEQHIDSRSELAAEIQTKD